MRLDFSLPSTLLILIAIREVNFKATVLQILDKTNYKLTPIYRLETLSKLSNTTINVDSS